MAVRGQCPLVECSRKSFSIRSHWKRNRKKCRKRNSICKGPEVGECMGYWGRGREEPWTRGQDNDERRESSQEQFTQGHVDHVEDLGFYAK